MAGAAENLIPIQGLRANLGRFGFLVLQVGFVGAMVGVERTVLPLLARSEFGLASKTAALSFILAFGLAKAPGNLAAGALADRFGRRQVLLAGWAAGLPAPLLVAFAPSWSWVIAANVLLGIQQALCWSTAIFMKVDVAGPRRRGLAIGVNEFAGYLGTAAAAYATGTIAARAGSRVAPFLLGEALALAGLVSALRFARETSGFLEVEPRSQVSRPGRFKRGSFAALCQAGLVTKVADVVAWGLLPLYFREGGLSLGTVALLAAVYPASWGALQPLTGALSDRAGRKPPIVGGMAVQGGGLAILAWSGEFGGWLLGTVVLGAGTALVYPVLLAAAGDVAVPSARASAMGLYRLWRDLGFVVGALLAGVLADLLGVPRALEVLGGVALASGAVVALTSSGRARTGSAGRRFSTRL